MPFHTTTKTALVLVTNGSEEIEFTTVVDLLVRAGIQTQSASVAVAQHQAVTCSRGVRVLPDVRLEDLSEEVCTVHPRVPAVPHTSGSRSDLLLTASSLFPFSSLLVDTLYVYRCSPLKTLHDYNLLVIPGGLPGATTLSESPLVLRLVQDYFYRPTQSALIGMICAGPLVALEAGLWKAEGGDGPDRRSWVEGKLRLTSHPSVKDRLEERTSALFGTA
jgi:protein DJ-1